MAYASVLATAHAIPTTWREICLDRKLPFVVKIDVVCSDEQWLKLMQSSVTFRFVADE
jgi:hypothetical protein